MDANIRVASKGSTSLSPAMEQDYTNWNPAVNAEVKSLEKNGTCLQGRLQLAAGGCYTNEKKNLSQSKIKLKTKTKTTPTNLPKPSCACYEIYPDR